MAQRKPIDDALTYEVIGAFYEVHNTLGYGFLESVYMDALEYELKLRGHRVAREVGVTVYYKGVPLRRQRIDMIVDDVLAIEAKSSYKFPPETTRVLYNYLRATRLKTGLALHFGLRAQFFRVEWGQPR